MFNHILVGTDGSGTAAAAVKRAVDMAKSANGRLTVMSAYPAAKASAPPFTSLDVAPGIEVATGLLDDVEKRYGDEVQLKTVAREGAPGDVLLEIAEDEDVDVIVVGNRGMTGAKRFVLGSVPNTISHHAPCNVLIVHTTDE